MSLSEEKQILLSQLVDGELPVDQANRVLAEVFGEVAHVLGSAEAARQLHAMLQLRQALEPWRGQEPSTPVGTPSLALSAGKASHSRWHVMSLASAVLLGGVLVAGGFLLGNLRTGQRPDAAIARQGEVPAVGAEKSTDRDRQPVIIVTPDERRDIARAFALHESVAGPLSWYAADDATIQVAPAEKGESMREPIAVVLRLSRDRTSSNGKAAQPKTYVIVCRNNATAAIELPSSTMSPNLRLRLLSTEADGQVKLQYALATEGTGGGSDDAALVGRRDVGLGQTSLGQLALNDRLVNVDASAWMIGNHAR